MNLNELVIKISVDYSGVNKGIQSSESKVRGFASKFSQGMGGVSKSIQNVGKGLVEFGDRVTNIGNGITNNITKPALGAAKSLAGMVLGKGWERMSTITEAKNKLHILGVEGEALDRTMAAIGDTVDGTAYSTAEFANTAAQAVSMGYKEGEGLEKYLQTVADMAAFTGREVGDISSITAKIASQNKLTGDTFQQLSDAAVPVLQWIQDEYGVTAEEARKMVSDGKISFSDYERMVEENLSGMAKAVGDSTLQGALSSTEAYIARLGAAFLGSEEDANSFAGQLLPLVNEFNDWLISMGDKAGQIGAIFGEVFGAVVEYIKTGKVDMDSMSGSAQTLFSVVQPFIDIITKVVEAGKKIFETLGPEKTAMIVAGFLLLGPVISLLGGLIGVIGTVTTVLGVLGSGLALLAGPVGIVIAVIAGLIAAGVLLYQNWDIIKEKASELKDNISQTFESAKTAVVEKFNDIKTAVSTSVSNVLSKLSFAGIGAKVRAAFESARATIVQKLNQARNTVSNVVSSIKQRMSFSGIAATVSGAFQGALQSVKDKMESAREAVSDAISRVKSILSGTISFPHVKIPHFSISGSFSLNPPSIPRISVSWYKKAMEEPYLFKGATLIGAGEAGDEMLYGRAALLKDIREASGGGSNIVINLNYQAGDDANDMLKDIARGIQRYKMAGVI